MIVEVGSALHGDLQTPGGVRNGVSGWEEGKFKQQVAGLLTRRFVWGAKRSRECRTERSRSCCPDEEACFLTRS